MVAVCLAGVICAPSAGATGLGPAPLPIGTSVLRRGDGGPAVRVLQGDLAQFGLYSGPISGYFGPWTRRSLVRFQKLHHVPATGVLDAATFQQVLIAFGYASATPAARTAPSQADAHRPVAQAGSSVEAVRTSGGGALPSPASTTTQQPAQLPNAPSGRTVGSQPAPTNGGPSAPPGRSEILAYWSVWGNNASELSDLHQNASAITWLSPYWYTLRGDGTMLARESDHAQVLAAAHADGTPVLALVNQGSGVTAMLSTPAGRTAGVKAIADMLQANPGITGVVIDFELLPASSRNDLTAFIQLLRSTLPTSETVGIAVMPKASSPGPSYAQVFDYAALGQAADFVQLMTYDRHSDGGPAGPISPNNWVEQVARYAASVIPPKKILIGVPGYGYDWVTGTTSAATVNTTQAIALAAANGVTPVYDQTSGENHFTYAGHTVWYESAQGVAQKYQIVQQLGLGGMALWTIGGEQTAFWRAAEGQG